MMKIYDMNGNVNALTVTNMSWTPELGQNLLSIVPIANKGIEVFLRKETRPSKIYFGEEVYDFIDIVDRQYIVKQAFLPVQTKKNISLKLDRGKVATLHQKIIAITIFPLAWHQQLTILIYCYLVHQEDYTSATWNLAWDDLLKLWKYSLLVAYMDLRIIWTNL